MVRFLHTADLQLGMKARDATDAGGRLREARLTTLQTCMTLAIDERVDFVVIAGDLFEDNQVSALTVSRAVQILQQADPIPVYVLPGNHDWLDAGSVYERSDFAPSSARNIIVLREPAPVAFGDTCILYPCPVTKRWDLVDPTDWIPADGDEDHIRIGVAHGSLPVPNEQREFPIELDTPQRKKLDYLALGDWHGTRRYESGRLAYPGTPEQTSFGEEGAGHVLLVTIEAPGRPPDIEQREVGALTWLSLGHEVSTPADENMALLREQIEGLPDGPNTLLRLTLTGVVRADELPLVEQLETWLAARCENEELLHAEVRNEVRTAEAMEGALRDMCEADSVVAGSVADLRRMAALDRGSSDAVMGVPPRSTNELITAWTATEPDDQEMSVAAREALGLLARLAGEAK